MLKELTKVPGGIQTLEAVETVTADDHEQVMAPMVDQARRHCLRLLDGCAVVSGVGGAITGLGKLVLFKRAG